MRRIALYMSLCGLCACYTPQVVSENHPMEVWRAAQVAETSEPVAQGSTEPEVVTYTAEWLASRAVTVHPEVKVAKARVLAAQTHAEVLTSIPALELRVTELHLDEIVGGERKLDLGLRFRPELPGIVAAGRARASEEVTVEEARRDRLALLLKERARALHLELHVGERRVAVLGERSSLLAEALQRLEAAGSQGAATALEISLARLAFVDAADRLAEASMELKDRRAAMNNLLALEPGASWAIGGPAGGILDPLEAAPAYETALEEALRSRPETQERAARLAQAHAEVARERLRQLPWLSFAQASREVRPKSDALSWGFAVGVDIPVERWFAGDVQAKSADLEVRRQEERAAVTAIAGQVAEAVQRVRGAVERYQEVRRSLVPAIEAAQAAGAAQASERALDPKRRLRLELSRLNTQLRVMDAEREAVEAQLNLRSALGRL